MKKTRNGILILFSQGSHSILSLTLNLFNHFYFRQTKDFLWHIILRLQCIHNSTMRKLGIAQKQAEPLTYDIMKELQHVCEKDVVGLRNKLLLQLGHGTMRRRSETCAFQFDDVQRLAYGKYALLLRNAKPDQFGEGKLIPISEQLINLIDHWSESIGSIDGYILRSFKRNLSVRQNMEPAAVNKISKMLQRKAKLKYIGEVFGHSFRVGTALDMLERGVPLEKIMLRGGWKSESTAMRYLRNWNDDEWSLVDISLIK